MAREARLVGFVILLAVIFVCAHAAGARVGPVSTSHSQVSYPGTGSLNGGMKMGQPASQGPAPAARLRGAGQ